MRISDWSSDVCSSDLDRDAARADGGERVVCARVVVEEDRGPIGGEVVGVEPVPAHQHRIDRYPAHACDEAAQLPRDLREIGSASCRESVCQYVYIPVVAVSVKKNNTSHTIHQP